MDTKDFLLTTCYTSSRAARAHARAARAQNETQGPCSLTQFRGWVRNLRAEPRFKAQLAEFSSVSVWKARPAPGCRQPGARARELQACWRAGRFWPRC